MRIYLISSLKMTGILLLLCSGLYPFLVWGIAQMAPNRGEGFLYKKGDKTYYANIGQPFDEDRYFWSRPSAVGYNAAGSGGSNKGPSNPEYLAQVKARLDTFIVHNPGVAGSQIPADLLTASGSGLDPHISVQAAFVQIPRVAQHRNIPTARLQALVEQHIEMPFLGLFGPSKVNVLRLNLALDDVARK